MKHKNLCVTVYVQLLIFRKFIVIEIYRYKKMCYVISVATCKHQTPLKSIVHLQCILCRKSYLYDVWS